MIGKGEHYALEVDGDSMDDAGIYDGDTVIIRRSDTAENGSIVVALIEENEVTLKRLRRKGASIALEPANKTYETRIFGPDQVKVQGCLVGTTLGPPTYRVVNEKFFGEKGGIETASEYWKHFRSRDDVVTEPSPRSVTTDAIDEFVTRIAEGRPENVGVRGVETTLTAIMGRMAMDRKREVTWEEMWNSEA